MNIRHPTYHELKEIMRSISESNHQVDVLSRESHAQILICILQKQHLCQKLHSLLLSFLHSFQSRSLKKLNDCSVTNIVKHTMKNFKCKYGRFHRNHKKKNTIRIRSF